MAERSSPSTSSSRKYAWLSSENHSLGDGGSRLVCSGCQGRKVLWMSHPIAQIHCSHCNLGRLIGSLDKGSHRQMRQPLPGRHHRHRSALLLLAGIPHELHRLGLGKLERKARQGMVG